MFETRGSCDMAMDQYLLIPFLMGWTSINPSYFDVNYRGTRFWHTAIWLTFSWLPSGKLIVCELENGLDIVSFPINSMVDLSSSFFVNVYEAGYFFWGWLLQNGRPNMTKSRDHQADLNMATLGHDHSCCGCWPHFDPHLWPCVMMFLRFCSYIYYWHTTSTGIICVYNCIYI